MVASRPDRLRTEGEGPRTEDGGPDKLQASLLRQENFMSQKRYDCIFIPGGGLLEDGALPPWTVARLEKALEFEGSSQWLIPLSAGTVHKPPPLDQRGFPIFESRAAADYLVKAGVDPERILTETCSYDTIGNAFFARTLFADPLALTRCLVITSAFHLARTEAAFGWVFSLAPRRQVYSLSFESAPDLGLDPAALAARREREASSLERLKGKIESIQTLEDFQRWLYSEHSAYAVGGESESLSAEELSSY